MLANTNLYRKQTSSHFITSWSGGKDSCLALYYTIQKKHKPCHLLNMITDGPLQPLKKRFVNKQAVAINIPIITKCTTWNSYEQDYLDALTYLASNTQANICVFGDIDTAAHGRWNKNICDSAGLKSLMPLWQQDRQRLMLNFLSLGFKALINVVNTDYLDKAFLGREINPSLMQELEKEGIDICGENGEYHTIVTDGPIFSYPLRIQENGIIESNQYCYLDFEIEDNYAQ